MTETMNGYAARIEPAELAGKRVLVYSMGIEGRDLARFFLRNGAHVTMSDTRTEEGLRAAGAAAPEGVERVVSGQTFLAPDGFDLVAFSQFVLRKDPALARARELRIPMTSVMRLFLQLCPAPVIGITGSSGKSTTTALVGAMAEAAGLTPVVAGNIGAPMLEQLDGIGPDSTVILEMSHTQLQYTDRSPWIAAVTNVTPNHLDQFSWDEYVGLKRHILAYQGEHDVAVMNADDPTSRALMASARGKLMRTSLKADVEGDGAWFDGASVMVRAGSRERRIARKADVQLRGRHNLANVVMASAIGAAAGLAVDAMADAIRSFRGVQHRLEVVGRRGGVLWVNDSIATSPERTIAGLESFTERVVLLLGGRDKNLPLDRLQEVAQQRCRAIVCFGEAGGLFDEALRRSVRETRRVTTLAEAVAAAAGLAEPGDVVLMAPAGTSFDAYPSFEARGEEFRRLVRELGEFDEEVTP
jgi:UDP-N-acetylmuramoylalanine--D-glutamate ligase